MSVRRVKSKCKIAIKSFSTKSLRGKTEFRDVLPPIKDSLSADLPSALEATTATPSEECDSVQEMSFYANKQKSTHEDWVQIRQHLLDSFVKLQVPSSESCCSRCSQTLSEPIRCADCGPTQPMYCAECERSVHEYVLHKPEVWQESMFVPFIPQYCKVWKHTVHYECKGTQEHGNLWIIDNKGRMHYISIVFCSCEPRPVTLLRFGLWASSPLCPPVAFSMELLEELQILTLECAVSVQGFVQMLRWRNNLSSKEASFVYRSLIGHSIVEYRIFRRSLQMYPLVQAGLDFAASKCPACPDKNDTGTLTISLDANFGLVRKANAGQSAGQPNSTNIGFFMDTLSSNYFVENYQQDNKSDTECHSFLAGNAIRSQARNVKLDIRGVFGSACRHEFPFLFVDMKHGEKLAYSIFFMEKILLEAQESQHKVQIIYDIACMLHRHLQRTGRNDILENVDLALPQFHAYGHSGSCQVQYSIRHQSGFGLTDGEGTERLWSYLRTLAKITKEMTESNRLDLLNDALYHYCYRKNAAFVDWLKMRCDRAETVQKQATIELGDILDQLRNANAEFSIEDVRVWTKCQKKEFTSSKTVSVVTWEHDYAKKLQLFFQTQDQLQITTDVKSLSEMNIKLKDMEQQLKKIEKQKKICVRWSRTDSSYLTTIRSVQLQARLSVLAKMHSDSTERAFLITLLRKYCAGQTVYIRINRQITKITKSLNQDVRLYNSISVASSDMPDNVTMEQARNLSDPIYASLNTTTQVSSQYRHVPSTLRIHAIEKLALCDRANEEIIRLREDIQMSINHLTRIYTSLVAAANNCSGGSRALITSKAVEVGQVLNALFNLAQNYVENLPSNPVNCNDVKINVTPEIEIADIESFNVQDILNCDDVADDDDDDDDDTDDDIANFEIFP